MPPGSGERFRPGGDIHAITEQITSPDHHIADVDADAELKATILGLSGARFCEFS